MFPLLTFSKWHKHLTPSVSEISCLNWAAHPFALFLKQNLAVWPMNSHNCFMLIIWSSFPRMTLLKWRKEKKKCFPWTTFWKLFTWGHYHIYPACSLLTELDANVYSPNSGYQPEVISCPKEHLATSGPSFGCHDYRKAIGIYWVEVRHVSKPAT